MEKTTYFYGWRKQDGTPQKVYGAMVYTDRNEAEAAMAIEQADCKMTLEIFSTTRQKDEAFTAAMNKVWHMASETGNEDVQEYIIDYFNDDIFDICTDDLFIPAFMQNESAMYGLLRGLMNYDWFWVSEDGSIDVENANDPDVAEALQPYVTKDMGLKALASFPKF